MTGARKFLLALAPVAIFALGCDMASVAGSGGKKLTLVAPASQTIERGKTNDVLIAIQRKDFSGPVDLVFDRLPQGVKVTNPTPRIPSGDSSATVTLHADPGADLVKDQKVLVTAKASDMEVSESFNLTVKE
jgi:hypothetical protein